MYRIKAHPTLYAGVMFRSRLEARWAVFFDLVSWHWEYEPIDLWGWTPDFRVTFACNRTDCPHTHSLLVEVKPYYSIEDFQGHPCLNFPGAIPADTTAAFGVNPTITYFVMANGPSSVPEFEPDAENKWRLAGNAVQWESNTCNALRFT